MRDFLAATRDRVVVFDGGMGATLEQFDLSLETDYRLPGRCHEALVLNRPDVIQGVHESMVEAGAEVVRDRHVPGLAAQARGVGPRRAHARDQPQAAEIAREAVGEDRFVAGSIGPTGHLPASDDPTLGKITLPRARRGLHRAGARPDRRRRRPARSSRPRRTSSRSRPRSSARARRSSSPAARVPIQTSVSLLPNGGKMLLGTDISRRAGDARGAQGRRHRPQLLDRPRGHARRDPLPRRVLAGAGPLHPERRHPAPGPQRRDDLPRGARRAGRHAGRVRRALRRLDRRRLLRHDARPHPRDRRALRPATRSTRAPGAARRRTSPR